MGRTGERGARALTCIRCPRGCRLTVELGGAGEVAGVRGNACARGASYARAEVAHPVRSVTTTVPVDGSASLRRLPVRTEREVPRERVLDVVRALAGVRAAAPVEIGDVVAEDVAGTGVDVVATARA
ncbi:DUF1667 domain-containing protein [Thermophilibacter mediterraneus]|uniref:DUF1667 domain-containing protein n=1 Tax=Thermophilibacter mediterraneus TaxID=1871031 RepID=UPI0023546482|nr:DUF1667 domain-containing protein [Thermophilibacter mediterraneus]